MKLTYTRPSNTKYHIITFLLNIFLFDVDLVKTQMLT